MPQNDNEIVVLSHQNDYYFAMMPEKMIGLECTVRGGNTMSLMTDSKVKIVGIAYKDSDDYNYNTQFYLPNNLLDQIRKI